MYLFYIIQFVLVLEASIAKLKSSTEPVSILRKPIYLPSKRFIPTKSCVEGENDEFCKKSLDDQKCSDQEEFKMDQILSSNLTKKSELSTATGMTSEKISIFEKFNPKDETDDFCQTTRDINHTMALIYGSLNNVGEYLRITRSARQFKEDSLIDAAERLHEQLPHWFTNRYSKEHIYKHLKDGLPYMKQVDYVHCISLPNDSEDDELLVLSNILRARLMIEIHEPILGRLFRDQAGSLSDERCVEFLYHSVLIPSICRFEFSNPKLVVVRPSFSLPDAISGSLHTFMQTCLDWMRHRSMEPLGICGANYILTNLFRLRMQKVLSTINESSRSIAGQTRSNESYTWDMPSDYHVPSVNGFLLAELLHTVKSVYPSQVNHSHNALPVNATISMASGFTEDDLNQLYFSGDWESLGRRGVPIIIGGGVPRW